MELDGSVTNLPTHSSTRAQIPDNMQAHPHHPPQPHPGRLWYVRRGDVVKGPFQTSLVQRYIILGRIKATDEVSLDREAWQHPGDHPMFSPAKLAEQRDSVLAREDERKPGDRRHNEPPDNPYKERRSGVDRRADEAPETVERRQRRARVLQSLKPERQSNVVPAVMAAIATVVIVISGFLFKSDSGVDVAVCDAEPRPGINWSNCRKEGLVAAGVDMHDALLRNARLTGADFSGSKLSGGDLSYADLVGANLAGADLGGTNMKGATMRKADLSSANLKGSDLSYADLSEAMLDNAELAGSRLGNAIWTDGRTCAPDSVGDCL